MNCAEQALQAALSADSRFNRFVGDPGAYDTAKA